jgi:dUTPase|nr:MAG TPA: dUTPase [Caudoviricetes sp.]
MAERRYYKTGEQVWSNQDGTVAVVKSVDTVNKEMTVYLLDEKGKTTTVTRNLWEFDKLRGFNKYEAGTIGFTKFRPTAKIPTKNHFEDAGFDVYLDIPQDFMYKVNGVEAPAWNNGVLSFVIKKDIPTLLPTGIGVKVSEDFYTDWANERGSTGLRGMATLSGVVDSGYRGEVFLDISPIKKDIVITNTYEEIKETADAIYFPVTKAVAQMIVRDNLHLREYELSIDDFKDDVTNRGDSKLGASGK